METSYDVFKGPEGNALWLGSVTGLDRAVALMNRMAESSPGDYFVFSPVSQEVVARTPKLMRTRPVSKAAKAS